MPVLFAMAAVFDGLGIRAGISRISSCLNLGFGYSPGGYQSINTIRGMRKSAIHQGSQCLGFVGRRLRVGGVRDSIHEPRNSIVQREFGLAIILEGVIVLVVLFAVRAIDWP